MSSKSEPARVVDPARSGDRASFGGAVRATEASFMRRHEYLTAVLVIGCCLAVGGLGGLVTASSVESWYRTLDKPPWNPPERVFGPVWTALYVMMGTAYWLVWRRVGLAGGRRAAVLFVLQLGLNVAWSLLFFGLRSPALALLDIAALVVAIWLTTLEFYRHSRVAAVLMVPYVLWVAYASSLNAAIVWLN
jgi:translocator protein